MLPEEYHRFILSWLRFNRRISIPTKEQLDTLELHPPMALPLNRFLASKVCNMDETPIPFTFADDATYNLIGDKTIGTNGERSGWDKRQATVILYVFADGNLWLKPKLIFKGTPTKEGGEIMDKEGHLYDLGVTVEFNDKAWNNGEMTLEWAMEEFIPTVKPSLREPALLAMDCVGFHKSPELLEYLRTNHVSTSMVPPGCTSVCQPLDTAVNKPFKEILTRLSEEHIEKMEALNPNLKWTTSMKRIQLTKNVAEAWRIMCTEKKEMLAKSFLDTGIYLHTDGSQDHLISIKGYAHGEPQIGNFWRTDKEIEEYQLAHQKVPEIGDNGEYILEDGTFLRTYTWLSADQLKAAIKLRGITGIGTKDQMIKALKLDDMTNKPGCKEFLVEGYIHQAITEKPTYQAGLSSWQVTGYSHSASEYDKWEVPNEESDDEFIEIDT